ncbi:MAG: NADH-quinone oxidoreductase subunit A [Bacteriovoracaceae bacterium]
MNLLPILVFTVVGIILGFALLMISLLLGKKRKSIRKYDIYESGVNPVGSANRKYDIKFFLTGILFLLFDIEIVFLFPWALTFKDSPNKTFLLAELAFFLVLLVTGYLFVILSKSLDWEE